MDILVLAEEDLLIGFRAAGVRGLSPVNGQEAVNCFHEILNGGHGEVSLLIVSAEIAKMIGEPLATHQLQGGYPLIAELPGLNEKITTTKSLVEAIKKAVGISL